MYFYVHSTAWNEPENSNILLIKYQSFATISPHLVQQIIHESLALHGQQKYILHSCTVLLIITFSMHCRAIAKVNFYSSSPCLGGMVTKGWQTEVCLNTLIAYIYIH